jgi:hypothetical protein
MAMLDLKNTHKELVNNSMMHPPTILRMLNKFPLYNFNVISMYTSSLFVNQSCMHF